MSTFEITDSLLIFWRLFSNLMAPDEMKNLGFSDEEVAEPSPNHTGGATAQKVSDDGNRTY